MPPEICPQCGALVPPEARACPECGSDEETGWSERAMLQRLDAPDEEFNYDEFVKEEFGTPENPVKPRGIHWVWWVIAAVLAILLLLMLTGGV